MKIGDRTRTHGMSKTVEYRIWGSMINRCENPNDDNNYRKYGARGISICPEWRSDFMAFYRDMGPRPSPEHSIDRKDSNGNYEPSNCRWATLDVQANNRGDNRLVMYRGVEMTLTQAIRSSGSQFKLPAVRWRLDKMGWDLERALSQPAKLRPPPKTHCPQGHEMSGYTVMVGKRGTRSCRTCAVERTRAARKTAQLRKENAA